MTTRSPAVVIPTLLLAAIFFPPPPVLPLGGSAATLAVVYGSATTVCTIVAGEPVQRIQCWRNGQLVPPILPNTSFDAVAGGRDTLCGVRSGGLSVICWNATFAPKRIYKDPAGFSPLTFLTIGGTQICGLRNTTSAGAGTGNVICWRDSGLSSSQIPNQFRVISSGLGFSCGVLQTTNRVVCWGNSDHNSIQSEFASSSMADIHVGGRHACGIDNLGFVICRGDNSSGQLNIPSNSAYEYRNLAVGENHTCAVRRLNRTAVCWGSFSGDVPISFEFIVSGLNFTCGLVTTNFTVLCWGPGWPYQLTDLPLSRSLPGACIDSPCPCNVYPESSSLCSANGHICRPCDIPTSIPFPQPPPAATPTSITPTSKTLTTGLLVFVIVGSVGGLAGICSVIYCLYSGVCFGKKKVHNSVQPTIAGSNGGQQLSSNPSSRSSTLRRQSSILMKRSRSGPSSKPETAEEYTFFELATATDNFSLQNKIGAGSFGVVYKGKLPDGRQVAIKRSESGPRTKKFQEKETAFDSELAFLSRLHHKHLVRLFGYCEENEERLLVYEYMKNGALYDHLHDKNNVEKSSNMINSWKVRIKIVLDAARGIEYLHNYADPPIIHRDIKSSNILLDENWAARVSDFGLSLLGPVGEGDFRPVKAAGTVGYIDPEYYGLSVLTAKSDVYGFGVVLLEVLTGKRAIFKVGEGEEPVSVVDYAVGKIMAGELEGVLDVRVGGKEMEAVELVAYTAVHCVNLEGKDRPTMTDIVGNLERALDLCEGGSYGSISSGSG